MHGTAENTIIIGGGIVGLSCAYFLARRGTAVTVIERDAIGEGASGGNAGLIAAGHPPIPKPGVTKQAMKWMFDSTSPLYIQPRFKPDLIRWLWQFHKACKPAVFHRSMDILATLGHAAIECFDEILAQECFTTEVDYHRGGQIEAFRTQKMRDTCRAEADELRESGFEVEELDQNQLHEREPAYHDDVLGAFIWKDSAFADPRAFTIAMAKRAVKHGATIRAGEAVESITVLDGAFTGVRLTSGDVIEGNQLVLAAGIWTTPLAQSIGIHLPMQGAKGYHINLTSPPVNVRMGGVFKETFIAFNPIRDGLRLAGTLEFSGLDDRMRRERLEALVTGASKYVKGIDQTERISEWFGYRPCTADGLPVIGDAPSTSNVYVATGHAMMGFLLGPITGRLISELILDEQPSIELGEALSVGRFAR